MTSASSSLETIRVANRPRLLHRAVTLERAAAAAVALAVTLTFCLMHRDYPVGVAQDDGLYVILAKALATGQGFRFINIPGSPVGVHYPPGYPVFLAALWPFASTFDARLHLFAVANAVLLGVAAAGMFYLARRVGMTTRAATICVLAGFLMPPALWMGTALLSEPLWLAGAMPWLCWAESAVDDLRSSRASTWLVLGLTGGAIALVRTQAAVLIIGLLTVLMWRRQWKQGLMVLTGAAVTLLPWQLWIAHQDKLPPELAAKYGAYAPWLIQGFHAEGARLLTATLQRNFPTAAGIVGGMSGPPGASWMGLILLACPAIIGVRALARRAPTTLAMTLAHCAIILAWPFAPTRFVWTSWPLVVLWVAAGIVEMHARLSGTGHGSAAGKPASRISRTMARAETVLLVSGAALSTGIVIWTGAYRGIAEAQSHRILGTVAWVRRNADSSALVASDDETAVYLYTGRRTVPTMSFSAASYARSEGSVSVLDGVFARYHPDLAIVSWNESYDAAHRLAGGPSPVLRAVGVTDRSVAFRRIR